MKDVHLQEYNKRATQSHSVLSGWTVSDDYFGYQLSTHQLARQTADDCMTFTTPTRIRPTADVIKKFETQHTHVSTIAIASDIQTKLTWRGVKTRCWTDSKRGCWVMTPMDMTKSLMDITCNTSTGSRLHRRIAHKTPRCFIHGNMEGPLDF